jgi:hypothetical protein
MGKERMEILVMSIAHEIDTANRHLKLAEDSHAQGSTEATNWYLRSIAHFLAALCDAELRRVRDGQ